MTSGNPQYDFSGLKALFLNCTLKRSPEMSNTEALMNISRHIMSEHGVATELVRPVDFDIAPGVQPDMTKQGWEKDDWPQLYQKVMAADILIVGTPIWLGEKSSVCTKVIERLYGMSGETNDKGQYVYYGKAGGCVVTGNEDGGKHCGMNILYSLQHIGFVIPPQSEAIWVGEAGPGPSYADENSGGRQNDFTQRSITFMSWNLMHMAQMLKAQGGIPGWGNQQTKWQKGERFGYPAAL